MGSDARLALLALGGLVIGAHGCLLVTDFDVSGAGGGAGGGGSTASTASGGGASAGGAGGQGCTLPGDGTSGPVKPWSIALGPFAAINGGFGLRHPRAKVALVGDKMAFGVTALALGTGGGRPVLLDTRQVAGPEHAFVVGWVDDGGTADAWPLTTIAPGSDNIDGAFIDVAAWKPGKLLVAAADGTTKSVLVELDLCTREEKLLLSCEGFANSAVNFPALDADPIADRIVLALQPVNGVTCTTAASLPACTVPQGVGPLLFSFEGTTTNGQCRTWRLPQGITPVAGPGGEVFVSGGYRGSTSIGSVGVESYCDSCGCPATCTLDPVCGGACGPMAGSFDGFFAHLAPSGSIFETRRAFDLGGALIGASVETPQIARVAGGNDVVLAVSAFPTNPYPSYMTPGWVFQETNVTTYGADVIIARIPPTGPAEWTKVVNQGGWAINAQLTQSNGELLLAGRIDGDLTTTAFADCADAMNGCAFFLPIQPTGALGKPLVVNSTSTGAIWGGDMGLAAWTTSGGDFLIAASVDGAVSLDHPIAAPPAHVDPDPAYFVNLVFARVHAPAP